MKIPRWLDEVMERIRQAARDGNVRFTLKALRELAALDLELDETDVCEILLELQTKDFRSRIVSDLTSEYLYIFAPQVAGLEIYVKVVIRSHCVVISFHEDLKHED